MKYTTKERQDVARLTRSERDWFDLFLQYEKGVLSHISPLCTSVSRVRIELVFFSCLFGNGSRQEIEPNLGSLFLGKKVKVIQNFMSDLRNLGANIKATVIFDDCEPTRVWGWEKKQEEISEWCQLILEDRSEEEIPRGWTSMLWSELEENSTARYEDVLKEMEGPKHALLVHQHLEHMRRFPNKKLRGDIRTAALRRVTQYALQGIVLEEKLPSSILIQSETPWKVKDPLYRPLRSTDLPIIHLFPERR